MIEARIDTYTEHFLFVEEPQKTKLENAEACMACGTTDVIKLSSLTPEFLDGRTIGVTGLALATSALAAEWLRAPGGLGTLRTEMRSKSLPLDRLILGITTSIMILTIDFILGWEIALIAALVWGFNAYRAGQSNTRLNMAQAQKEKQRIADQGLELKVLERRRKVWSRMGYCRECGTVHDLQKHRFTAWYNMLELFDNFSAAKRS